MLMHDIACVRSSKSQKFKKFIYWYIGNKCNYRCSYCHPNYYNGTNNWHPSEVVVPFLNQFPDSFVIFSGGEPTFHPQLFDIFQKTDTSILIGLATNGSRPLTYWQGLLGIRKKISITFSYHYEHLDTDTFYNTAKELALDPRCEFLITFLLPPDENWYASVEFFYKLRRQGINVQPKLRFQPSGLVAGRNTEGLKIDDKYTQFQIDWANEQNAQLLGPIALYDKQLTPLAENVDSQYLISRNITNFVGWKCYAPKQNLLIAPNGDITTGLCAQRKKLGNIFDKFDLNAGNFDICKTTDCTGWIDVHATKIKPFNL